jgi:uncharacterized repeat protein (TIGR01451 family)
MKTQIKFLLLLAVSLFSYYKSQAQCSTLSYYYNPIESAAMPVLPVGQCYVLLVQDSLAPYTSLVVDYYLTSTLLASTTNDSLIVAIPCEVYYPGAWDALCNSLTYSITLTDLTTPTCTASGSDLLCGWAINDCSYFVINTGPDMSVHLSDPTPIGLPESSAIAFGDPPYTYTWTSTDLTALAALSSTSVAQPFITAYSGLSATFCLEITDATGCTNSDCLLISEAPCSISAILVDDTIANTISNYPSGLSGADFTYLWSTGDTTQNLNYAGLITLGTLQTFTVVVSDQWGCSVMFSIDVIDNFILTPVSSCVCNANQNSLGLLVATSGLFCYGDFVWHPLGDTTTLFTQTGTNVSTFNPSTYGYSAYMVEYFASWSSAPICSSVVNVIIPVCIDTICGVVFYDNNNNGWQDAGELPAAGHPVYCNGNLQTTNALGEYSFVLPCSSIFDLYTSGSVAYPVLTCPAPYSSTPSTSAVYTGYTSDFDNCDFHFGLSNDVTTISGYVYVDANNNGIFDAGETPVHYASVSVGASWTCTNTDGFYQVIVAPGTYNVVVDGAYYFVYTSIVPSSISQTLTMGDNSTNNNFGLQVTPGLNLVAEIIPHTTVTPGFPAWYDIIVCNEGTVTSGGTLNYYYDGVLTFDDSYPIYTTHNASAHTLTYNIPSLAPGQCATFWVDFTASSSAVLGDNTIEMLNIIPSVSVADIVPNNNIDTVHQIIIGSWDPNNKLPVESNLLDNPNEQIISSQNANQRVEYVINFQNTGSAPAVNVLVEDFLSSDVAANSFQFLGSSHIASVSRTGNQVRYQFHNIMLPDSTHNELESHGWVRYSVNANAGLAPGHQINDLCEIYFDFNAPVVTNPGTVTMVNSVGIADANALNIALYPNPAQQTVTIEMAQLPANATIEIYDAVGKRVINLTLNNEKTTINIAQLQAGIYTCKISSNGTRLATSRITKL